MQYVIAVVFAASPGGVGDNFTSMPSDSQIRRAGKKDENVLTWILIGFDVLVITGSMICLVSLFFLLSDVKEQDKPRPGASVDIVADNSANFRLDVELRETANSGAGSVSSGRAAKKTLILPAQDKGSYAKKVCRF